MSGTRGWRERYPDLVTCVRCLEERPVAEVDRLLWCEGCQATARARALQRGWIGGGSLTFVLALYIWFVVQPDPTLIPTLWIAMLVVAFYLGSRVAREMAFGWERINNRRAAEAIPPSAPKSEPPAEPPAAT